jgi:hypothetical protein
MDRVPESNIEKDSSVSENFFQNHIVQWLCALALLLNALLWGVCVFFFHNINETVLMRYNAYLGVDPRSGGPWYAPYQIPFVASIFFGIFVLISMMLNYP